MVDSHSQQVEGLDYLSPLVPTDAVRRQAHEHRPLIRIAWIVDKPANASAVALEDVIVQLGVHQSAHFGPMCAAFSHASISRHLTRHSSQTHSTQARLSLGDSSAAFAISLGG